MTPLVLIPGTLCDERLWDHQKRYLSDLAEVWIADITCDNTIEQMAKRLLAEAPERFALAGLSLGGIVAMEVVRQAPERVTRLMLADTNPNPPRTEQIEAWESQIQAVQSGGFLEVTNKQYLPLLTHEDRKQDTYLVQQIRSMFDAVGEVGFLRQLNANIHRPTGKEVLPVIRCPALVLAGKQDILCPASIQIEMAGLIPGAKMVLIERCGHLSTLEQPEVVTAVMRYWLQENVLI